MYIKEKKLNVCFSTGGSRDLWNELQKVLSALETSSGHGRKMLRLQTQDSERVQAHHLSAGRESWVQAIQVLIQPLAVACIYSAASDLPQALISVI